MSELVIPTGLLWTSLAALAALVIGTASRLTALRGQANEKSRQRIASLKSWWCVAIVVIAAALCGPLAMIGLMVAVSLLAHREFANLPFCSGTAQALRSHDTDTGGLAPFRYCSFAITVFSYLLIAFGHVDWFIAIVPLLAIAVPSLTLIVSGDARDAAARIGRNAFSLLLLTYALGHTALLSTLPTETNPVTGPAGWFLFLVAITQINDIAQALVGRRIGTRRLTPISPGKTWEGFIGGAAIATVVAVGLSRLLVPMTIPEAFVSGVMIAAAGLIGDLNMSLVKRDAGVKDSGNMVPGQGGILDRIDSLTFTAPVFYYYVSAVVPVTIV